MRRTKNLDRTKPEPVNFIYRRYKAALDLRGLGVEEVARQAGVSSRHVWFALRNERRPSAAVLAHIRAAVGDSAWPFVIGACDTLTDSPASEAQPCR
jgi:transcriptional regulator with XRE-family HTH domain